MEEEALLAYLDSPEFIAASSNATRLVAKLKNAATKHEFYETHQILRTIYFRFINTKEKIPALSNLLYQGSCYLLKYQEFTSGQDTATLFLETVAKQLQAYRDEDTGHARMHLTTNGLAFHSSNKTMDWDICTKISNLAANLPESEIGQTKFVAETLKVLNPKLLNRDLLHHIMAREFWKRRNLVNGRYHFLHCASLENAEDIADLLVELSKQGNQDSEDDLFISQFTLQFLCLHRPSDSPTPSGSSSKNPVTPSIYSPSNQKTTSTIKSIALKIFATYCLRHTNIGKASVQFDLPLLNFIFFLIGILDSNQNPSTFKLLCKIYKYELDRDPKYEHYLSKIGAVYFGIVDQSKQPQGGFFNNILMSLLDGADDDDDDNDSQMDTNQGGNDRAGHQTMSTYDELD